MKKNKILITLLVLVFSLSAANSQAQFGKIGKDLKKKVKKTTKAVTKPSSGSSSTCVKYTEETLKCRLEIDDLIKEKKYTAAKSKLKKLNSILLKMKKCPTFALEDKLYYEKKDAVEALRLGNVDEKDTEDAKSNPDTYLAIAIKRGDQAKVDKAIGIGVDLNKSLKSYNKLPLMLAIEEKQFDLAKYLIEKGADANGRHEDEGPLYSAVKVNNIEMVKLLLAKGAKHKEGDNNAFVPAAKRDNLEMVKLLDKTPGFDIYAGNSGYSSAGANQTAFSASKDGSEVDKYIQGRIMEIKPSKLTDATNKKYANRIVLSTEKIPALNANDAKFSTKLRASKNIYGRIYFNCPYNEYFYGLTSNSPKKIDKDAEFGMRVSAKIEGQDKKYYFGEALDKDNSSTSCALDFINDLKESRAPYARFFRNLKQGENKVTLIVSNLSSKEFEFKGDFIFVKNAGDTYKIGKTFANFKAGTMNTPAYKSAVLKAIQSHATAAGWKEKFAAVKIRSNDWNIVRNELTGIVLYRTIDAWCYAKWPDGHCTVQSFRFKQDYNGSSYSKTYKRVSNGSQTDVDCN